MKANRAINPRFAQALFVFLHRKDGCFLLGMRSICFFLRTGIFCIHLYRCLSVLSCVQVPKLSAYCTKLHGSRINRKRCSPYEEKGEFLSLKDPLPHSYMLSRHLDSVGIICFFREMTPSTKYSSSMISSLNASSTR